MSDLSAVKAALEKGLRTYKAFEEADKTIALLQNVEQVTGELQAKLDKLVDQVAGAELALGDKQAALADVESRAQFEIDNAREKAAKIVAAAREEAAAVAEQGAKEAAAALLSAEEAKHIAAEAEARTADAAAELQTLNDKIAAAKEAAAKLLA